MAGKKFEDFLEFRNKVLAKKEEGKSGFHAFDNATAQLIFDAKPTSLVSLGKIKGFPEGGARHTKYGKDIISWFMTSSVFGKK